MASRKKSGADVQMLACWTLAVATSGSVDDRVTSSQQNPREFASGRFRRIPAILAQTVDLQAVHYCLKAQFSRDALNLRLNCPFRKFGNLSAGLTGCVTVMFLPGRTLVMLSVIAEHLAAGDTAVNKQFHRAVDRGRANPGVVGACAFVNLLNGEVLFGFEKHSKDGVAS